MMNILTFAASTREASNNKKLLALAMQCMQADVSVQIDHADFKAFEMPLYDGDLQVQKGLPSAALNFIERLKKAQGLVIAVPEYNFSIPGTLKNLIDWVSRDNPMPWTAKHVLLMSASPSMVGGNRGLWATRVPLEACGAHVFPDMFSLATSHVAFEENGQLKDATLQERLFTNIKNFLAFVSRTL